MQLRVLPSVVLFVTCLFGITNAQTDEPLLHSVIMDHLGKFIMSWTPLEEDIIIELSVSANPILIVILAKHSLSANAIPLEVLITNSTF